jgi:hypothetical protein
MIESLLNINTITPYTINPMTTDMTSINAELTDSINILFIESTDKHTIMLETTGK